MATSSPTPNEEQIPIVQIEQIPAEDIELMEGLWRSRCPRAHAPNCGTGDGMYSHYTSHLLELLILCTVHLIDYVNLIILLCLMKQVRLDLSGHMGGNEKIIKRLSVCLYFLPIGD